MNRGIAQSQARLEAVNGIHSQTALRLISAREGLERKTARAAFSPKARQASGLLEAMPVHAPANKAGLTPEQEAELENEFSGRIEKLLGIVAVMIAEAEADISEMNELLDIIAGMNDEFFDIASLPLEKLKTKVPSWLFTFLIKRVNGRTVVITEGAA